MIKVDTTNPIATPFLPDGASNPTVEYEYATRIFVAADGTEQRQSVRSRPLMKIRYSTLAMSVEHAAKHFSILERETPTAIAIIDFMQVGVCRVFAGLPTVQMVNTFCAWTPGLMVQVYDNLTNEGIVTRVLSFDPISGIITLQDPVPASLTETGFCGISSVVSGTTEDIEVTFMGPSLLRFDIETSIYPQEISSFPVAQDPAFIFAHRGTTPPEATISRPRHRMDFGSGPIFDFVGADKGMSGVRTYTFATAQLNQTDKESLVRFFRSCRGRAIAFTMPEGVVPGEYGAAGRKFRFASDILTVEHTNANETSCTFRVVEVRK